MYANKRIGEYILEEQIGKGSFASVWRAKRFHTNETVAVKVVMKNDMNDFSYRIRLQREISILRKINHPNIVSLINLYEDNTNYYIVMEHMDMGNFLSYVNKNGPISEANAKKVFLQVISALDYLHDEAHVVHRDIKCENVMLDHDGNVKLIDFGLSNTFIFESDLFETTCGSLAYSAPEMLKGRQYSKKADIWSAGVFLYAIVAGYLPYDNDDPESLKDSIIERNILYPFHFSPELMDLFDQILNKNPEKRIGIQEIKKHQWLSGVNVKIHNVQSKKEFVPLQSLVTSPNSLNKTHINLADLAKTGMNLTSHLLLAKPRNREIPANLIRTRKKISSLDMSFGSGP